MTLFTRLSAVAAAAALCGASLTAAAPAQAGHNSTTTYTGTVQSEYTWVWTDSEHTRTMTAKVSITALGASAEAPGFTDFSVTVESFKDTMVLPEGTCSATLTSPFTREMRGDVAEDPGPDFTDSLKLNWFGVASQPVNAGCGWARDSLTIEDSYGSCGNGGGYGLRWYAIALNPANADGSYTGTKTVQCSAENDGTSWTGSTTTTSNLQPQAVEKSPSTITVNAKIVQGKVRVNGQVTPNKAGQQVQVIVKKWANGKWVKVASKPATLSAQSGYVVKVPQPSAAKCQAISKYAGDAKHLPATAKTQFAC